MSSIGAYIYLIRGGEYQFPYQECVKSLLPLCDGVHVLTDPRFKDTESVVGKLEQISQKVMVHQEEFDFDDPGIDGKSKARVRELAAEFPVTGSPYDWLIQMDADEVFRQGDIPKVEPFLEEAENDLVCCGVINWFNGNHIKVNSPWSKERFSRNLSYITHGIPVQYRTESEDGYFYVSTESKDGGPDSDHADGAGYIDKGGNSIVGDATTFNDLQKLIVHSKKFKHYVNRDFCDSIQNDIWVHHYSWWAIPRRWQREVTWNYFWGILRGKYEKLEDYGKADGKTADFWAPVPMRNQKAYIESITDEMSKPEQKKFIFHVDWIKHPKLMDTWIQNNEKYTYGRKKQELCKPRFSMKSLFKLSNEQIVFD